MELELQWRIAGKGCTEEGTLARNGMRKVKKNRKASCPKSIHAQAENERISKIYSQDILAVLCFQ